MKAVPSLFTIPISVSSAAGVSGYAGSVWASEPLALPEEASNEWSPPSRTNPLPNQSAISALNVLRCALLAPSHLKTNPYSLRQHQNNSNPLVPFQW